MNSTETIFEAKRPNGDIYKLSISIAYIDLKNTDPNDQFSFLHPQEQVQYEQIASKKRQKTFLFGRFAAKKSIRNLLDVAADEDIFIDKGIMGHPVLKYPNQDNLQVSIAHSHLIAGALTYPMAHPMAIDIQQVRRSLSNVQDKIVYEKEKKFLKTCNLTDTQKLAILWSAKEALSKVIKTGLSTSLNNFKISGYTSHDLHYRFRFEKFIQYKAYSFLVGDYAYSIISPYKSELSIDFKELIQEIQNISTI